jgi:hypothetical protein|tara:strand:+ start:12339 stop:12767 length:429 start_codon:yes stop_codon:yes gene_type:complete
MTEKQLDSPIKIVKLINGDDVVCVLPKLQLGENSKLLRLEKPFQLKYIPQLTPVGIKDYVALIKWAAYTPDELITIPKDKILTITNAGVDMIKSYFHVAKDYSTNREIPKDKPYNRRRLTDNENEELNEIFNENYDDNGTIH